MADLVPLKIRPGFNRDATRHGSEGSWFEGDKVRFRDGMPEVIGGWTRFTTTALVGTCRSLVSWARINGEVLVGAGTTLKYYVVRGGLPFDITPIRNTTAAGDVTFSATDGSTILTVTDTAHGASIDAFVIFSGAVSLGGNVTADVLNQEYQIVDIIDANTYTVELAEAANASDSGNGGASVVGTYLVNPGLNSGILGLGWGADPWGDGGWGEAGTTSAGEGTLRIWSHDNFGEDLVINPRNGNIYYWDSSAGYASSNRAVALEDLSGATDAPVIATQTMVSDQDRHVICFGCNDQFDTANQDPLLIRWSDQEDITEWNTASTTNTSGSLRLSAGSEIVRAIQTKREILIFTDSSLHSMQWLGPPYTFGIQDIARSTQIAGPNAVTAANESVYWMADGKFMAYDGVTKTLPCTVDDYVFSDFNKAQAQKVAAGHNSEFSEVWWFYPSSASDENDRYVIFNYDQGVWYFGTLNRTAWLAAGIVDSPLAASTDGYLYGHEEGYNDGSMATPRAISAFIESSSVDIGTGSKFFFSRRALPDLTFRASTGTPSATMTFKAFRFPGSNVSDTDSESVLQTATSVVEQYTEQLHIRLRGRAVSIRVSSDQENTSWRLGVPRLEMRTDGSR